MSRKTKIGIIGLGLVGVIIGVLVREPIADLFKQKPIVTKPTFVPLCNPTEIAKPHLKTAEEEAEKVIDEHIKSIDSFFAECKKNSKPFADEALSWSSKWRLAVDKVPYTKGDRHSIYIREKFEEYLFTPTQLEDALKKTVLAYFEHVRSIEGKMLLALRADMADMPQSSLPVTGDESEMLKQYENAIKKVMDATGHEVQANVVKELVTIIVAEVMTTVAIRMGVSGGIIAAGGVSGTMTLGIGLVIGLIVDQIVSWVWYWWADPAVSLATELNKKFDEMRGLIVDGSKDGEGLKTRLKKIAKDRDRLRRKAIHEMLSESPGEVK